MSKIDETADAMNKVGSGLMGCGCLMTIFITIPFIIILFLLI